MSNVDKQIEKLIIEELIDVNKLQLELQKESQEIIDAETEYLDQQLSTGEVRTLIRELLIDKLNEEEKMLYLELPKIQRKIRELLPNFHNELASLLMERVVEQSDYSQNKTRH